MSVDFSYGRTLQTLENTPQTVGEERLQWTGSDPGNFPSITKVLVTPRTLPLAGRLPESRTRSKRRSVATITVNASTLTLSTLAAPYHLKRTPVKKSR